MMVLELRIRELLWSKTEDGERGTNHPQMTPYPPVEGEEEHKAVTLDAKAQKFLEMERKRAEKIRPTTSEG